MVERRAMPTEMREKSILVVLENRVLGVVAGEEISIGMVD
jgi:hypothetical protein